MNLATAALDQLKMYINPEAYFAENEIDNDDGFDRKNSAQQEQIAYARETGELRSPKFMRDAIHEFYQDEKRAVPIERTFVERAPDGSFITHDYVVPEDEDGDLG